ncbi:MAG: DUF2813 domain-containing protein [Bryobacteraceae bacterium]|nr:DUF2813 domain-containing protein [Solibacteraceae bacterium]MCO5349981.1 DUF2813 domain-containing protein [Bryobacteraceae bacterium]
MLLRKLHIRNFRGIEDLEFELGPTTLLIGENNCGKTTILDAVRLTLSRASGRKSGTFDVFDYRLKTAASEPQSAEELSITATFSVSEGEELSEEFTQALSEAIVTDAEGRSHIIFRVTSQFDATVNDFVSDWSFLDTDLNALGSKAKKPSLLQEFQKIFPVFYLSALRDAVREFRSGQFWSPFVKNPSIPDNIKADLQKQIAELNAAVLGAHTSLKTVKTHLQKVQELVPVGQTDTVEIEALPGRISDLLSNTQVSISSPTGASIPLGRHGAGTQSLSVMFLFEAYLTAMLKQQFSEMSAPILALEEPEAHLHPFAIRSLWATINSVPGQKIIASHSGDLVANAPLNSIRRLHTSNGKVRVGAVPPGTLDDDEERKICFHVTHSRGELLFARCWLLVEGESEFWILGGLANLLNKPLDKWGVRIIPYQHSGQNCLLKTANGLGIPWFLLADGDSAGRAYIKSATAQLNGTTPADHLLGLAEDNVEVHLCACGFEKVFAAHVSPQKANLVTAAPGTAEYWKQILKANDDTPKPMVVQEVCAEIEKGAGAPPILVGVLDRALKLAGA